jgi:hypothetical protein
VDTTRLLSARLDRPARFVVVMSEQSIAHARAQSTTRRIGKGERDAVVERARTHHDALRPQLEGHGAGVLKQFQGAVSGIKVEAQPSQIAKLPALPGVPQVLRVATHRRSNSQTESYIGAPAQAAVLRLRHDDN